MRTHHSCPTTFKFFCQNIKTVSGYELKTHRENFLRDSALSLNRLETTVRITMSNFLQEPYRGRLEYTCLLCGTVLWQPGALAPACLSQEMSLGVGPVDSPEPSAADSLLCQRDAEGRSDRQRQVERMKPGPTCC